METIDWVNLQFEFRVFTVESTAEEKLVVLQAKRDEYQQLINKFMKKEDQITKVAVKKDPLSRDAGTVSIHSYKKREIQLIIMKIKI